MGLMQTAAFPKCLHSENIHSNGVGWPQLSLCPAFLDILGVVVEFRVLSLFFLEP